jgi:uncharacterized Zn finger protein (UPF0148 family)
MDKFGVVQCEDGSTKTAGDTKKYCPTCGQPLLNPDTTGGLYVCPTCGTKPFEELD